MGVDANGILLVSAEDKASGKSTKITITSEKGRLSDDEIERMVQEAEEFAEEDKIEAKNSLESYIINLKLMIQDTLKDKIASDDKEKLTEILENTQKWLEEENSNSKREKEEYEEKQKEIEAIANPIISKAYSAAGDEAAGNEAGEDMNNDADRFDTQNNNENGEPEVEEVD